MERQETDVHPIVVAKQKSPRSSEVATRPDEQSVAKANEAIAIRPKRGKLTLLSRRIYNVFLYHAQQQGVEKPSYSILLSELIDDARTGFLVADVDEAVLAVSRAGTIDRCAVRQEAVARFGRDRMVDAYLEVYVRVVTAARGHR